MKNKNKPCILKYLSISHLRKINIVEIEKINKNIFMKLNFNVLISILKTIEKQQYPTQFDIIHFYNDIFTFSFSISKSRSLLMNIMNKTTSHTRMIEFLRICKNKYENIELEPLFYDEHYIKEIEESYRKIFVNIESVDETIKFLI